MKRNIKEIYDIHASGYDDMHFHPNSAAEYVEKRRLNLIYPYLLNSKGLRVLDVACGTGTYLELAERIGTDVVGSDISKNMIQICKNKEINNTLVGDYHILPFEDKTFDMILCINAIHYSNNPKKVLSEMGRILSNNGIILFTYFNILNFRLINKVRRIYKKNYPIQHEHRFLPPHMNEIFKRARLTPIYYCGINLLPFPSNSKRRNKKFLDICHMVEDYINKTPLMYVFFNEYFVVLKKKT